MTWAERLLGILFMWLVAAEALCCLCVVAGAFWRPAAGAIDWHRGLLLAALAVLLVVADISMWSAYRRCRRSSAGRRKAEQDWQARRAHRNG